MGITQQQLDQMQRRVALGNAKMLINPPINPKLVNANKIGTRLSDAKHTEPQGALAADGCGKAPGTGCPTIRFTLCRTKLLDVDAKWGSVKDLLDGLQYAGLIHGDKEGEISLEVCQEKVASNIEEKTVIEIIYPQ